MTDRDYFIVDAVRSGTSWALSVRALPDALAISDTLEEGKAKIRTEIASITGAEESSFDVVVSPGVSPAEVRSRVMDIVAATLRKQLEDEAHPITGDPSDLEVLRKLTERGQVRTILLWQTIDDENGRLQAMDYMAELTAGLLRVLAIHDERDPLELLEEIAAMYTSETPGSDL